MAYAKGEGHHAWTGDSVGLGTPMHYRVIRLRGHAKEYPCEWCNKAWDGESKWSIDWAHVHDTDPTSEHNCMPMCRKCHMLYDKSSLTEDDVRQIKKRLEEGEAQWRIGESFGVSQMTISRIKTGKTWTHLTSSTSG